MLTSLIFLAMSIATVPSALLGSAFANETERRPHHVFEGSAHDPSRQFTYAAAKSDDTRRRTPAVNFQSEDEVLTQEKRAKLQANTRDLCRNYSVAGWAIRRHLDYCATFDFHAKTNDESLNVALENFVWEKSKAFNFDVRARHCRENAVRMLEAQAVVTGDNGLLVTSDGKFQGIEGDRVRDSHAVRQLAGKWVQGVKVDDAGRTLAYALHRRKLGGFEFERTVPNANMIWHGYYDRWDQIRGVSPIVSALNQMRDVYENFDYALARAKVSQLFAFAITRKGLSQLAQMTAAGAVMDGSIDEEVSPTRSKPYKADFGKGPVGLDLEPGDDAKFIESASPATQFQDFTTLVTMVALKALDIPFSFFDESHTNFFGSRGSWLHYERSAFIKRKNLADVQDRMLIRMLQIAVLNDEFLLPSGKTIADLDWEFVPQGMPWWKPSEEINGDVQAIAAGLNNPERICRARGTGDVYDNIRRTAAVMKFAEKEGVPLSFAAAPYVQEVAAADAGK